MPELTDLDSRLGRARTEVLDAIEAPPLTTVRRRAAARRRTRAAAAGMAVVAVVAGAAVLAHPMVSRPAGPAPAGPGTAGAGTVGPEGAAGSYHGQGITLTGLRGGVVNLPGMVSDLAFTSREHGYVLTTCQGEAHNPCQPTLARTEDGGVSWTTTPAVPGSTPRGLLAFPAGTVAVRDSTRVHVAGGPAGGWVSSGVETPGPVAAATPDQLLSGPGTSCQGPVEVWDPHRGLLGPLTNQPDFTVCWVARQPTADGAWWVGGRRGDQPTVAVTRDGGRSWSATGWQLPGGGGPQVTVQVAALGSHVWATARGATSVDGFNPAHSVLRAVYHSADGGRTFTATRSVGIDQRPPDPWYFTGDAVPLPDGRLLTAGQEKSWWITADDGATFRRVDGTLPTVWSLSRAGVGWFAFGLFDSQWSAFSADGSRWQKLPVR